MTDGRPNRPARAVSEAPRVGARWSRALLVASLLTVAPLAACEQQAYDAPTAAVAPPPPPPVALAGAPSNPVAPDASPPPMETPSAAPPTTATADASAGVVAMEPIPNPVEAPAPLRRRAVTPSRRALRRARPASAHRPVVRKQPSATTPRPHPAHQTAASAAVAPIRSRTETDGRSTKSAAVGDPVRSVAELRAVLADAVQKSAILSATTQRTGAIGAPPGDVTLVLPAEFADTVRTEAGRRGLSEAAASVNILAHLSGGDAKVTPDDTQIQPLLSGQPTRFRWSLADAGATRTAPRADLKAQLLGAGGDTLDLGSITAAQPASSLWKLAGVVLLALVAVIVIAVLDRRRARARVVTAAGRPLPFDMNRTS